MKDCYLGQKPPLSIKHILESPWVDLKISSNAIQVIETQNIATYSEFLRRNFGRISPSPRAFPVAEKRERIPASGSQRIRNARDLGCVYPWSPWSPLSQSLDTSFPLVLSRSFFAPSAPRVGEGDEKTRVLLPPPWSSCIPWREGHPGPQETRVYLASCKSTGLVSLSNGPGTPGSRRVRLPALRLTPDPRGLLPLSASLFWVIWIAS